MARTETHVTYGARQHGSHVLTRIEIDGFKTFRQFALDLQPFKVIAGANASEGQALFDAIQTVCAPRRI